MITVHEDERQEEVALRAAHHGFIAMFLASLAASFVAVFVLEDEEMTIVSLGLLLVAILTYHVSLWRGGWFEYVREVTNGTEAARTRARRQAAWGLGAMGVWLFISSYALNGRPLDRALLGSAAGVAAVAALVWWFYLRRLPPE